MVVTHSLAHMEGPFTLATLSGLPASQLTEESRSGYTCNYTYDFNGNRMSRTIAGGISETYSYTDEKLMRVEWNGGSSYKDYTYDVADRIDSIDDNTSVRTFAYDDESRLTSISGAYSATYEYNGLNTRIEKTEASVTRTFMRDGVGPTSPVLNDGAAAYTPGTSERRGGTTTYMHSGIKNADLQTNTSEVQTAERTYDAFGNTTASSGSFVGPFGYGGQFGYQEDGSGLKLLGNRYYDPSIGRFLTPDPIKDGNNWYAYCGNNPIAAYDADGLRTLSLSLGIGGMATIVSGSASVGIALDFDNGHIGLQGQVGGGAACGIGGGPGVSLSWDENNKVDGNGEHGFGKGSGGLAIGVVAVFVQAEITKTSLTSPVNGGGLQVGLGTEHGESFGVYAEGRGTWTIDLTQGTIDAAETARDVFDDWKEKWLGGMPVTPEDWTLL